MKVIDTSALLAYIFREDDYKTIGQMLLKGVVSLDLILKESLNVILTRLKRKDITEKEAEIMYDALKSLIDTNVKIIEQDEVIGEAFHIAKEHSITMYDSLYLALAKKLGYDLITLDKFQSKVASGLGVGLELEKL